MAVHNFKYIKNETETSTKRYQGKKTMTGAEIIAITGVAAGIIPNSYKERAFRYMEKLLSSFPSEPRYIELLRKQKEQRLSVDENRLLNVLKTCKRNGEILGEEDVNTPITTDNPYEDDWLSAWESEACHKSTEEMQERFARILAGEIKRPGSFSIRTIRLLGQIDAKTAETFNILCSGCISITDEIAFLPVFGKINSLRDLGIIPFDLIQLNDFSLLRNLPAIQNQTGLEYTMNILHNPEDNSILPFIYEGKRWVLVPVDGVSQKEQKFKFQGIFLSQTGIELMQIVDPKPINPFSEYMRTNLERRFLKLVELHKAYG